MYQVHQIIQYNEIQNSFPLLFFFYGVVIRCNLCLKKIHLPAGRSEMEVRGVIPQVLETVINFLFPFCVLFLLYVKFTLVVLLLNWISKVFHLSSHFLCNKGIRGDKTAE